MAITRAVFSLIMRLLAIFKIKKSKALAAENTHITKSEMPNLKKKKFSLDS